MNSFGKRKNDILRILSSLENDIGNFIVYNSNVVGDILRCATSEICINPTLFQNNVKNIQSSIDRMLSEFRLLMVCANDPLLFMNTIINIGNIKIINVHIDIINIYINKSTTLIYNDDGVLKIFNTLNSELEGIKCNLIILADLLDFAKNPIITRQSTIINYVSSQMTLLKETVNSVSNNIEIINRLKVVEQQINSIIQPLAVVAEPVVEKTINPPVNHTPVKFSKDSAFKPLVPRHYKMKRSIEDDC